MKIPYPTTCWTLFGIPQTNTNVYTSKVLLKIQSTLICVKISLNFTEPGAHTGGQQRQRLCSVRAVEWPAQPGGRAEGGSGDVKEHPGVWEGDRLVEQHPALPEAEAAGGGSTESREPPTLLPPSRKRGPKRWGGMEKGPCSGGQANLPPASLTCPVALKQQIWGSGMSGTGHRGCGWRWSSIREVAQDESVSPTYYDCLS